MPANLQVSTAGKLTYNPATRQLTACEVGPPATNTDACYTTCVPLAYFNAIQANGTLVIDYAGNSYTAGLNEVTLPNLFEFVCSGTCAGSSFLPSIDISSGSGQSWTATQSGQSASSFQTTPGFFCPPFDGANASISNWTVVSGGFPIGAGSQFVVTGVYGTNASPLPMIDTNSTLTMLPGFTDIIPGDWPASRSLTTTPFYPTWNWGDPLVYDPIGFNWVPSDLTGPPGYGRSRSVHMFDVGTVSWFTDHISPDISVSYTGCSVTTNAQPIPDLFFRRTVSNTTSPLGFVPLAGNGGIVQATYGVAVTH